MLYTRDQIFEEGIMDLHQITEYQPQMAADRMWLAPTSVYPLCGNRQPMPTAYPVVVLLPSLMP